MTIIDNNNSEPPKPEPTSGGVGGQPRPRSKLSIAVAQTAEKLEASKKPKSRETAALAAMLAADQPADAVTSGQEQDIEENNEPSKPTGGGGEPRSKLSANAAAELEDLKKELAAMLAADQPTDATPPPEPEAEEGPNSDVCIAEDDNFPAAENPPSDDILQNGQEQDIKEGVPNILKITVTTEQSPGGNKLGFNYVKESSTGRYIITSVAADGLCGQAGLQTGQEMLEINGIFLRGMDKEGVMNLLFLSSKSGRVTITVTTSSTQDIEIIRSEQDIEEGVSNILKITVTQSPDNDELGFTYVQEPSTGRYFITSVAADGLCGQAGLQTGQEMLEINGIFLRGMDKEGVMNLFPKFKAKIGRAKIGRKYCGKSLAVSIGHDFRLMCSSSHAIEDISNSRTIIVIRRFVALLSISII
jgi:hypothetical protein